MDARRTMNSASFRYSIGQIQKMFTKVTFITIVVSMNEFFRRKYGPWAVATGASDGIGRALAIEVARSGLNVVLVARNEEKLKLVSKEIEDLFHVQTKIII